MDNLEIQFGPDRYKILPEGFYEVELKSILSGQSKFGDVYEFTFEIKAVKIKGGWQEKFVGCQTRDMVGRKRDGAAAKFKELAEAMTGKKFNPKEKITSAELIGKRCYAYITIKSEKTHNNKITRYVSIEEYQKFHAKSVYHLPRTA